MIEVNVCKGDGGSDCRPNMDGTKCVFCGEPIQLSPEQTEAADLNECKICGQRFSYSKQYHECKAPTSFKRGESWVDECMRKQREGIRK